jgi:hypothetical protein
MKKSELKEYIRETIISELTEVDVDKTRGTAVLPKASNPADIKKLTDQGVDVELKEEEEFDKEPDLGADLDADSNMSALKSRYDGVVKLMQSIANKWKNADEPEKSKHLAKLKKLTNIKNELTSMMNPSLDDEDEI